MKRTSGFLSLILVLVLMVGAFSAFSITASAAETVGYIDREWNGTQLISTNKTVSEYTVMTSETVALTDGWYVVKSDLTFDTRLTVSGTVHLILTDGVTLTVNQGISVNRGNELYIYGQSENESVMGKIVASASDGAAIGGDSSQYAGKLVFNGGSVTATSDVYSAAIGSGSARHGYDIVIQGGVIGATSSRAGAAIGSGNNGGYGKQEGARSIRIHGGKISAEVPLNGAAAIGGGYGFNGGDILITGGMITATSDDQGAAIGGGYYNNGGNITITGGTIIAKNTQTHAQGGAGIGGGYYSSGGNITITGGNITAVGGWGAAGIGGYENAGNIVITGGTISSTGNVRASALGGGVAGKTGSIAILTDINNIEFKQGISGKGDIGFGEKDNGSGGTMLLSDKTINVSGNFTLRVDYTVPAGYTLVIPEGATLTIPENVSFRNNGTIQNNGTFICQGHDYEYGVCLKCGEECTHAGGSAEYSNVTGTTHDAYYYCCGATVTAESHSFVAPGVCDCGAQAVASVKVGSTVTYYADIYEAAAYAVENSDSVMTLLADVELSGAGLFSGIDNKKSVTLDLNGKTLLKNNDLDNGIDAVICWDRFNYTSLEHSTLTINDSLGGGRVVTTQWHALYTTSSLVINGGTFEGYNNTNRMAFALTTNSISSQYGHTITINGGTFIANNGVSTDNFMTVTINGGTFRGIQYDFHNSKELYGENSPYGGVVINSASFPGGMKINSNYSDPIMKLLAKNSFVYKADGSLASLTDTIKNISGDTEVKIGADLSNATVVVNGEYAYIGKPITPADVVVTIQGRVITPEHYTLSYANNTDVGTATVTVTAKGSVYTGTVDASFTIEMGTLAVDIAPEVTFEFGDTYVGKDIFGGKVVIVGNTEQVVTGKWTWVDGTDKAVFTPDVQYAASFEVLAEEVTVTQNVIASSPIITLSTPSPAIMPGMRIRMIVDVKNSFDGSITELPTQFRVTYSVNGGSPTTVSGIEFTLPADVTLGDSVEVYVENLEEVGKYLVARSNTVKLAVGQVDYTGDIDGLRQELQDAVDALNDTLAGKANASDLESAIERLEDVIANLRVEAYNYAELGDRLLQQELLVEIEGAKLEAIDTAAAALNAAKTELQAAIDANETDIEDKVARLDTAYKAADVLINSEIAKLQADDAAIRQSIVDLESKMNKADKVLEDAIKAVEDKLDAAKTELQAAIDANETDIEEKVAILDAAYKAADVLINGEIAGLKADDAAIRQSIANLESKMNKADKTLTDSINQLSSRISSTKSALEKAISNLETAMNKGDADLSAEIAAVNEALAKAVATLESADSDNKAELTKAMNDAYASLDAAIKAVQKSLDNVKAELEAEMAAKTQSLETFIIAVCAIAGVSFVGSGAFIIWFFVDKKRTAVRK